MAKKKKSTGVKLYKKKSTAKKGGYKVKKLVRYQRTGKKTVIKRYKQKRTSSRARISRALAKTTKGGRGKIRRRPGYTTHVKGLLR